MNFGFVPGAKSGIVLLSNSVNCPVAGTGAQILATLNGQWTESPDERGGRQRNWRSAADGIRPGD